MDPVIIIAIVVLVVGGVIFVMLNRSWGNSLSTPSLTQTQYGSSELLNEEEVRQLVEQGRKIEAIKLVRERSDRGLREAKNYVEDLESSMTVPAEFSHSDHVSAIDDEVRSLLIQGDKIRAIKRVCEHTNWGLKEAKEYVDAFETTL